MLKHIIFGAASLAASAAVTHAAIYPSNPISKKAEQGFSVGTNAALKALKSTEFTSTWRTGFYAEADSPRVVYKSTNSACSLNSGNGDNGSQIRLTDGKCAIADFSTMVPTPMIWGAKGDGTTDDTVAVQAAVTALQGTGLRLSLGTHRYGVSSTITQTGSLEIFGGNLGNPNALTSYSGFIPLTANMAVLSLSSTSGGSNLHDFAISARPTGMPTTGSWIVLNGNNTAIRRLYMQSPCGAIDEQSGNSNIIENNFINNYANAGCGAVKIGSQTTGGNTIGTRVLHNVIAGSGSAPAEAGITIYDSGGGSFFDNDILYSTWGTKITPGNAQIVQWATWTGDEGGDTNKTGALLLDAQNGGMIEGLQFTGSWSSNSLGGPAMVTQSEGTGKIVNISFVGHRFYANGPTNNVVQVLSGTLIKFDASQFCLGAGGSGTSLNVGAGVVGFEARNSVFGNCNDGGGISPSGVGIAVASASTRMTIVGNNLALTTTPLSLTGNPTAAVISGNQGLDNINGPTITAAATISLGPQSLQPITGTTAISTINGFWSNRFVILAPISAGVNFTTGGNVCNALSPTANVAVFATYTAGLNCWTLK